MWLWSLFVASWLAVQACGRAGVQHRRADSGRRRGEARRGETATCTGRARVRVCVGATRRDVLGQVLMSLLLLLLLMSRQCRQGRGRDTETERAHGIHGMVAQGRSKCCFAASLVRCIVRECLWTRLGYQPELVGVACHGSSPCRSPIGCADQILRNGGHHGTYGEWARQGKQPHTQG